jgi:meso-butanediol dehydrogenase / (S,S)-butanediol dehydrogenase / diacetyl reductase
MDFSGKIALVTGASSGIGAATADLLAERNARVFCAQRGTSNHEDILEDLSDPMAPTRILSKIIDQAGALDILVNNAGIMREGSVNNMPLEDWYQQIAVNLTAPFLLIRNALPLLKQSRGSIVNVGSIEGLGNNLGHAAYGASKAGLHGLTRAIAVDHGEIRCNAVAPGWIETSLNEDFVESMDDVEAFRNKLKTIHPVGRTGAPLEVANLICWLASSEASFVTGQVWVIDGGRMSKLSLP